MQRGVKHIGYWYGTVLRRVLHERRGVVAVECEMRPAKSKPFKFWCDVCARYVKLSESYQRRIS
jgi:hypothetical protein